MSKNLRFSEFIPFWFFPAAIILAFGLYPLGLSKSLGFLYGLGVGLLDLWLMFKGLVRLYGSMAIGDGAKDKGAIRFQFALARAYLARYLLLGLLLFLGLRLEMVDFFAAAGGLVLPRLVLWGWGGRVRVRSSPGGGREGKE